MNRFINGREWSHIVPRSAGGDDSAANGRWEPRRLNRARGNRVMTPAEVRHAEQLARSAGWRQRINSAARRPARGAAAVTATTITRLTWRWRILGIVGLMLVAAWRWRILGIVGLMLVAVLRLLG